MDPVRESIEKGAFLLDLKAQNIEEVCDAALDHCSHHNLLPEALLGQIKKAVLKREKLESTAIGNAVSVPHGYIEGIVMPLTVLIRLRQPVNLDAPDDLPVRFVFLLLGPPDAPVAHLEALARIARLMSDDDFRDDLGQLRSRAGLLKALDAYEGRHRRQAPQRSQSPLDQALLPMKAPGHGLVRDARRRYPYFASDIRDGLNRKSLSAILFLFFACLAPSVTFGGVMAATTDGAIGTSEMLLATALCGCVFALLSGQPLLLLGGDGTDARNHGHLGRHCSAVQPSLSALLRLGGIVGLWLRALAIRVQRQQLDALFHSLYRGGLHCSHFAHLRD